MELSKLKECFHPNDIEWRIQSSGVKNNKPWGRVLAYVTNRAIMERLDDVCGQENWKNEYKQGVDGGVICKLSIKCGDEWITKEDGAENTAIESIKGGLSGSMKRAAVQWGIGRYLYKLTAGYADFSDSGIYSAKIKVSSNPDKYEWHKWSPPQLPNWAVPMTEKEEAEYNGKALKEIWTEAQEKTYRSLHKQGLYSDCKVIYEELKNLPTREVI